MYLSLSLITDPLGDCAERVFALSAFWLIVTVGCAVGLRFSVLICAAEQNKKFKKSIDFY